MTLVIQMLALNLLFILVGILVLQIWLDSKERSTRDQQVIIFITAAFACILCLLYPLQLSDNFIYDFRHTVLWFAGLYGGPAVAIGLLIIIIIARIAIGGLGIVSTIAICSLVVLVVSLFYKKFRSLSSNQRILASITFASLVGFPTIGIIFFFFELPYHTPDIWLGILFVQIIGTGIIAATVEVIQKNFTLKKRLIQIEKLEAVSHLAASISHEVRNPLTTSRGFIQLLFEEERSKQKKEFLRIALDEMDRAELIIRDYLTFAKPAPSKVSEINVKTELLRVIDIVKPLANMNSVKIDSMLFPFRIKGDIAQFQQCFLNIVKNSVEAMPNGGTVEIKVEIQPQHISIVVSDNGIGMSHEQIARLGEPYFSTKTMKGTGLGMMVVYRIVESMKGKIDVKSNVGKGTRFTVRFPRIEEQDSTNKDKEQQIIS
ncbi:two-component sensor histidine kinase [Bacillus sp. HMF5848]|uniref:ATP-binding protein n=1 Tax=Bacillus sp. HMF5848 TaxID=2495421 RepID=UPI000F7AFEC8|nr:ATP-binding protein [Bacillus sp. HMF5848]RSK29032.1 two-component sensor histidine kinase [Bacillus sp. HMF5848]